MPTIDMGTSKYPPVPKTTRDAAPWRNSVVWKYKHFSKKCKKYNILARLAVPSASPRSLLQPLQHHQHHHHDKQGVVHLWGMVCGSSLIYLSCAMLIRCHMSCLTLLWPYYVIPMWWILNLLEDLWDVNLYHILDVWVDAYCYPVFITCSNQTCVWEHV
jgi:hypothetical protein